MKRLVRMASLCLIAVGGVFAQITGDIRGLVLDGQGAAISKAKVTLKSLDTGESRSMAVTDDGGFNFSLLRVGNYELKAEATGFRSAIARAAVRVGETADVRLVLEVGQVTETVTVTDAVSQLDTQSAQIQNSVVGKAILELPMGRNANAFALMMPGIVPVTQNNSFLGTGSFNSNGGRGRGNNITVDGITTTDVSSTGTGGVMNPLIFQALAEVKFITNNFNAEHGRNSSAQALYVTHGGTNELHGELFEYFGNDKLNARPFFDRTGKANIVRENQYGFVVGGPLYIPKVLDLRNKLFWYVGYEGVKERGAGQTRIARVPTPAMLSQVTDPTARALVQQYQVPSDPSGQITTASPNTTDLWKFMARVDVNLTDRDRLWFRYNPASFDGSSTSLTFVGSDLTGFGATNANNPRQAVASHTHTFGPTAVNEFRFGFGQSDGGFPIDTPYPLGPRLVFVDGNVSTLGVWDGLPQGREQRTFQFTDNFTIIRGSHILKMGGEYYYLEADSVLDALVRGTYQFANWADFAVNGTPTNFSQRFGTTFRENRVKNVFAFFQDDWRATRNLTFNLGVRMEWSGGPVEKNGIISNLNLDNDSAFGAAGAGPFGLLEQGKPSFDSNSNWAPRLGFAWTPGGNQKTVIRGGYGIAYDFIFLNPITNQRSLPPFVVTGTLAGTGSFQGGNSFANLVGGRGTIQAESISQVGKLSPVALNFGAVSPAIAQNLSNPQVHQWNVGVQRDFHGWVAKASYVGTKGNYLQRHRDINLVANPIAPSTSLRDEEQKTAAFRAQNQGLNGGLTSRSNRIDPRYNTIALLESSANSNYHSGQFEVTKRTSNGFLFMTSYTFAKSIDDGSDALGVIINDSANQQDPRDNRNNRAVSGFDVKHRVAFTHSWELPWGKGSSNWAVRQVLAGWIFSGITSFRTGFPVTLDSGARLNITPITVLGGGTAIRPNASGPVNVNWIPAGREGAYNATTNPDGVQPISAYANGIGLSQPLLGNIGNLGRNALRLNGESNFDWNVSKNFSVGEGRFLQFRCEFYNTFNNTAFQDVNRNISNAQFGQYTSTSLNARSITLGLRFAF